MPRGMLPEIRAAYKQALAELRAAGKPAKPLYHQVRDSSTVSKIVSEGPRISVSTEEWKPPAFYASDNLDHNSVSTLGEIFPHAIRKAVREGRILRVVPKPEASTYPITEKKLIQDRSYFNDPLEPADTPSLAPDYGSPDITEVLNADGLPGLTEYLIHNPKAVRIFSKDKAWLPMIAGGIAASVLGIPDYADAVMLPEVRRLMLEAQRLGGKKLFHSTLNPKKLMTEGIGNPLQSSPVKELHKPKGFYAADRVEKIPGHLSGVYADTAGTKALRGDLYNHMTSVEEMLNPEVVGDTPIVRMILKPDARVREIPETFMRDYNRELKNIRRDLRKIDGEPAPMLPLSETELTQHWQDLADVLKIDNVDGQPRLAEWLTLNPEKVQGMYWENMSWTPEGGTVTHGPWQPKKFGRPERRGASAVELGTKQGKARSRLDNPSESVGGFEPLGPGPKPDAMSGFDTPESAEAYFKDMYKMAVTEGNELMKKSYLKSIADVKKYAKQQAGQSKLGIGQLNPYQPGEIKVKNYRDTDWSGKPVAGAIAAALGVGGLVGTASDADAFPIGKLKAINKPIANATRSTEEFYHLLGHKIRGKEVVDVLRNPKNGWRYVIVKDEKGKRYQLPMTKDYLNVYAGAKGTQDYLKRFRLEGYQGKKLQALKSLNIRENKRYATEDVGAKDFKEWNKSQMLKAKEIDPELVNDYAYVKVLNDEGGGTQGQSLYMPREYADFLAAKGYVKILKH